VLYALTTSAAVKLAGAAATTAGAMIFVANQSFINALSEPSISYSGTDLTRPEIVGGGR